MQTEIDETLGAAPPYEPPTERLPGYKLSLQFFGMGLVKTEFKTPYHYNGGNRSWKPVMLEINSTQLKVYDMKLSKKHLDLIVALYMEVNQLKDLMNATKEGAVLPEIEDLDEFASDAYGGSFDCLKQSRSDKIKSSWQRGKHHFSLSKHMATFYDYLKDNGMLFEPTESLDEFLQFRKRVECELNEVYTLSNLSVGEAPSLTQVISSMVKGTDNAYQYNVAELVKYKNTLRVRVELKQILIQFWSFYGMVHWFRNLCIGKDLSEPLETRNYTRLKSIPSHNDSHNNALLAAAAAAAEIGRGRYFSREEPSDDAFDMISTRTEKVHFIDDGRTSISSSNASSQENSGDSVFSSGRRGSVASSKSSSGSSVTSQSSRCSIMINDFKLVSYDHFYANIDKQYMSNCMPTLCSGARWSGHDVTISNFMNFLDQESNTNNDKDIFIPSSDLNSKSSSNLKKPMLNDLSCRNFVVHKKGLVSIKPSVY